MRIEYADNRGFALSSFPHHRYTADEKKDRTYGIFSFLVGEPFDERLMKNYPTDCQMLAYAYHQIISLSDIINPYGATGHVIRRTDDAHGTAMYDGLDAGADTGISHRRKIP